MKGVWGYEPKEFSERIQRQDLEFLKHLDYERVAIDEILTLEPGTPYYLSFLMDTIERRDIGKKLLQLQWDQEPSIWTMEAGKRLIMRAFEDGNYGEAETRIREFMKRFPEISGMRFQLLKSLYLQEKDSEVLGFIKNLSEADRAAFSVSERAETDLFRAVSSFRTGTPGWQSMFSSLFLSYPYSQIHERAFAFLKYEPSRLRSFAETDRRIIFGVDAIGRKSYTEAYDHLQPLVEKRYTGFSDYQSCAYLYLLYYGSGKAAQGAAVLSKWAEEPGALRFALLEMAGRLYRKAESYRKAIEVLEKAYELAPDAETRDRIIWYLLDCHAKLSPETAAKKFGTYARVWSNPSNFVDLFDEFISSLVQQYRWDVLHSVFTSVGDYVDVDTKAKFAFILARAVHAGLYTTEGKDEAVRNLLETAASGSPRGYYSFLASYALGRRPRLFENMPSATDTVQSDVQLKEDYESLYKGYLRFGLIDEAYEFARVNYTSLSAQSLREHAGRLEERERYIEGIRLMSMAVRQQSWILTREDMDLLYPRPFLSMINDVAERQNLHPAVFFALVREESHFDREIVSFAGAVGLTQLMPSTAKEVARSMAMESLSLTDPYTNLSLGGTYLRGILKRLDHNLWALLSYNAGTSRMRRWLRAYETLPDELLLEAVPFSETREYGKKLLVSSVIYGYRYEGVEPGDMIQLFFPAFP